MTFTRNNLKLSQKGETFLKDEEGLRLKWYADIGGAPTIGWGHKMTLREQREMTEITIEKAQELFDFDVKTCEIYINANIRVPLNQNQFDALVSFIYNLGAGALEHSKSTLRRLLDAGDYVGASKQFIRWNKVRIKKTGKYKVSAGLTKRRARERDLFLKPVQGVVHDCY